MELREKGLGGWDANSTRGEDALGGWAGSHNQDAPPPVPKMPMNAMANEVPSRTPSPAIQRSMSPQIVSPIPQSPMQPAWNGGNQGGMIHGAGNAYSGGYGGNANIPRSPSFPLNPQVPQQRGFPGGFNHGGYQRF